MEISSIIKLNIIIIKIIARKASDAIFQFKSSYYTRMFIVDFSFFPRKRIEFSKAQFQKHGSI